MIHLTVKTLDSQNHSFTVEDNATVKHLKDQISEAINFPVESQRLIYCGRVLQDEKLLSEYGVNGKVIHLVQRPPPQPARNSGSQRSNSSTPTTQGRRTSNYRQPRLDGNAMYLGAMAFPADLVDTQGTTASRSPNLVNARLVLARRMLRRAMFGINRLENPIDNPQNENADQEAAPEEAQRVPGSVAAGSSSSVEPALDTPAATSAGSVGSTQQQQLEGLQQLPFAGSVVQAAQAVSQAIAAAVSASHAGGLPNITIVGGGQSAQNLGAEMEVDVVPQTRSVDCRHEDGPSTVRGSSRPAESTATSSAGSSSTSNDQPSSQRGEFPRTALLAEVLDILNRVSQRLQPFFSQYHALMREDPLYQNNTLSRDSQNVFNGVSEVMHFLSHAYHILSDIICDFSQPPPRALRCRPVVIQHSTVLQAGIPIQAQISVLTNRRFVNDDSTDNTNRDTDAQIGTTQSGAAATAPPVSSNSSVDAAATPATTSAATAHAAAHAAAAAASTSASGASPHAAGADHAASQSFLAQRDSSQQDNQIEEATFSLPPTGNLEFFMEVGPGSITIDSLEATVVTNAGSIGGDGIQANVGGSFPWGAAPPPEFFQNLMQAVAGHMIGRGGASPSTTTSSQGASSTNVGAANGGQNSQARGNTATHPTTATQTRSTSRPHVHLAPAAIQSLGSTFDPFLPCNSHHIRQRNLPNSHSFVQGFSAGASSLAAVGGAGAASANEPEAPVGESPLNAPGGDSGVPAQRSGQTHKASSAASKASDPPSASTSSSGSSVLNEENVQGESRNTPEQQQPPQLTQSVRVGLETGAGLLSALSNFLNTVPAGYTGQPVLVQSAQAVSNLRAAGTSAGLSDSTWTQVIPPAHSTQENRRINRELLDYLFSDSSDEMPPELLSRLQPPRQVTQQSAQRERNERPPSRQEPAQQQPVQQDPAEEHSQLPSQPSQQLHSWPFQRPPRARAAQPRNGSRGRSTPLASDENSSGFRNGLFTARDQFLSKLRPLRALPSGTCVVPDVGREAPRWQRSPADEPSPMFHPVMQQEGRMSLTWIDVIQDFMRHRTLPGSSLLMSFLARLAQNMTVSSFFQFFSGNLVVLNDIQPHLQKFLLEVAYKSQAVNETSTNQVVECINDEIRPYIQALQEDLWLREDIDLVSSVVCLNRTMLRKALTLILEENDGDFSYQIMNWFHLYARQLFGILQHCCVDRYAVDHIVYFVVMKMDLSPGIKEWAFLNLRTLLKNFRADQSVLFDEIRPRLVFRVRPNESTSKSAQILNKKTAKPEPMETDASLTEQEEDDSDITVIHKSMKHRSNKVSGGETGTSDQEKEEMAHKENETRPQPASYRRTLALNSDSLPSVVLGSEAWHSVIPPAWVPLVTRDLQNQRKQSAQPSLSDAYLAGMPSKRRKVVCSQKPVGVPISHVISEGVRSALEEAAIQPGFGVEAAGEDIELQAAYREQVRSSVQQKMSNRPDFTPERYPHAKKYFKK